MLYRLSDNQNIFVCLQTLIHCIALGNVMDAMLGGGTDFFVQTPPLPGFPVISSVIQRPLHPRHQAWGIKIGPTPSTRCRWPGKSCILLTPSTEGSEWYNQSPTGDQEISHTLTRDTDRKQTRDYLWYQPRMTARREHKCAQSMSVLTFTYRGRCD